MQKKGFDKRFTTGYIVVTGAWRPSAVSTRNGTSRCARHCYAELERSIVSSKFEVFGWLSVGKRKGQHYETM